MMVLQETTDVVAESVGATRRGKALTDQHLPSHALASSRHVLAQALHVGRVLVAFQFQRLGAAGQPFLITGLVSRRRGHDGRIGIAEHVGFLAESGRQGPALFSLRILLLASVASQSLALRRRVLPLPAA